MLEMGWIEMVASGLDPLIACKVKVDIDGWFLAHDGE